MRRFRRFWAAAAAALLMGLAGTAVAAGPRLAVMEFDGASTAAADTASLGSGLQSMLTTDLAQVGSLTLVERARLRDVRAELKLGRSAAFDTKTAARVGQLVGATHLVLGSFTLVDKKLRLDCRLIEVATGKVVMAASVEGERDAFFELEKTLVGKLIATVGVALSAKERGAVARIHTTDFEAFRRFSEGVHLFDEQKYDEALAQLKSASLKDEDFKLARITLEEYQRLAADLRSQAQDVESARAELQRLERDKAADKLNAVRRKLFEEAARPGKAAQERRAVALFLLASDYGAEHRGLFPGIDRFAHQRTADALAQRYWIEAQPLFPRFPPTVHQAMRDGPRMPDSTDDWDAALDRATKRLTTWDVPQDDGQYADHYRQLLKTYRLSAIENNVDEFARRLHLDLHREADLRDRLYTLGLKLDPDTGWRKYRVGDRALLRRRVLDLDESTRLFASMRVLDNDPQWLRHLAAQAETNGKLAALVAGKPPRDPQREYVLLSLMNNADTPPSDVDGSFARGALTPVGAYRLTKLRDLGKGAVALVGDVPVWVVRGDDLSTGVRVDPLRTDELRVYHEEGRTQPQNDVVILDGTPRKDVQLQFEMSFRAPPDFWPNSPHRDDTMASRTLGQGRPAVTVLLRAVDVDRDDDEDPKTHSRVPNPLRALGLVITREGVDLAQVQIPRGSPWGRDATAMTVKVLAHQAVAVPDEASITVQAQGAKVSAHVAGKSLSFDGPAGTEGFVGLAVQGPGYVAIRKPILRKP